MPSSARNEPKLNRKRGGWSRKAREIAARNLRTTQNRSRADATSSSRFYRLCKLNKCNEKQILVVTFEYDFFPCVWIEKNHRSFYWVFPLNKYYITNCYFAFFIPQKKKFDIIFLLSQISERIKKYKSKNSSNFIVI